MKTTAVPRQPSLIRRRPVRDIIFPSWDIFCRDPVPLSPSSGKAEPAKEEADLTGAGKLMRTPQCIAPEQRERSMEVGHRADIYALGVVFYEILTGELPQVFRRRA
jgi:serine/threonine protein kinase